MTFSLNVVSSWMPPAAARAQAPCFQLMTHRWVAVLAAATIICPLKLVAPEIPPIVVVDVPHGL